MRRVALALVAAVVVGLSAAGAHAQSSTAQSCGPTMVVDAWRQAEAAHARKDFAAAAAQFRALAEQGLGPAQHRLAQMLAEGQGGAADLVEAWRWMVLAAELAAPGAREALPGLQARVSAEQRAQGKVDPTTWQPKLGPCLARDPRVKRPDGSTGYNAELLVNRVLKDASATGDEARRSRWLATSLESVRTGSPRYLIYFKALHGIGFVGKGAFVVTTMRDGQPMLAINETFTDAPSAQRMTELITAAIVGVHSALVPQPVATETVAYKGHTLRTTPSAGGKRFVEHMKYAIDMEDQLPPDLAKLARAATDLRYDPQRLFDARGGAVVLGMWMRDPSGAKGHMAFTENFSMHGPSRLLVSLVSGGVFARREGELAEAKRQLAEARKRGVAAEVAKTEQRVKELEQVGRPGDRGDCELEDVEIKAMEALKLDAIEINRKYRERTRRGCS